MTDHAAASARPITVLVVEDDAVQASRGAAGVSGPSGVRRNSGLPISPSVPSGQVARFLDPDKEGE